MVEDRNKTKIVLYFFKALLHVELMAVLCENKIIQ